MIPKNSVKPLELVISALHSLKEEKGSSPQHILKYLVEKYNVNAKAIKTHVQCGLKRGLSFGLITQKSGLYRLNDVLSSPSNMSEIELNKTKNKFKSNKEVKKNKSRTVKKRKRKYTICGLLKGKRKSRKPKEKKDKKKKKSAILKLNPRRNSNETKKPNRSRKPNRRKSKPQKFLKTKTEKVKRILPEREIETPPPKAESIEAQCSNVKDEEYAKTNVKA